MKRPRTLNDCHSILDLRHRARARLPVPVFDFMEGAAETEWTARRNTEAFDNHSLIPRCLVDVASVATSTTILGQKLSWPLLCSPTGASRLFDPQGELAVARAAARAGILYGLSTGSTYNLEEVAAASAGPKMFQLYLFKNRDVTSELIGRCKRSGYNALCLTVDVPVVGKRERDLRAGFSTSPNWSLDSLLSFARHPLWSFQHLSKETRSMANFADRRHGDSALQRSQLDPSVTWKDVREIVEQWSGPFALKGVMSPDDARRAADAGVTAVIVSNHGGRQLDGAAAPLDVLPDIVRAVGDRVEVVLDGGVRRGVHILKALALGAKACAIGRPYLYGLGAGGEAGVSTALEILRTEFVRSMQLSGCTNLADVNESIVRRLP